MAKSVRSVAVELHENARAIEAWRATLPEPATAAACASALKRKALASCYRPISFCPHIPPRQGCDLPGKMINPLIEPTMLGNVRTRTISNRVNASRIRSPAAKSSIAALYKAQIT
jgi:hypothetical protein